MDDEDAKLSVDPRHIPVPIIRPCGGACLGPFWVGPNTYIYEPNWDSASTDHVVAHKAHNVNVRAQCRYRSDRICHDGWIESLIPYLPIAYIHLVK
jgi:hypothetical protein